MSNNKAFLKSVLFGKKQNDETKSQKLVKALFVIPEKAKGVEVRHYIKPEKEAQEQQADLLFLPTERFGYKYCLVVVDIFDNRVDVEPLKFKDAVAVAKGLSAIYNRGILKKPNYLNVDSGSEFKGSVADYSKANNIILKVSATARHSQTAFAEYINKLIGKGISFLQTEQELEMGKAMRGWMHYIRQIVETINEKADENRKKNIDKIDKDNNNQKELVKHAITGDNVDKTIDNVIDDIKNKKELPVLKKDVPLLGDSYAKDGILNIGQKVRYQLDYPISAFDKKRLHGTFRAGDIRWSKEIHTIDKSLVLPNQPVSYLISGITNRSFTRQQLQII